MSVTLSSSVKRRNPAHSLSGLVLVTSLGLTLAGCSGAETPDDPLADGTASEAMSPELSPDGMSPDTSPNGMAQPSNPDAPAASATGAQPPTGTDEEGPGAIDLDDDAAASNDTAGDGVDGNPDPEASGTPATPVGELDVPGTDHCAAVEDWEPEWVQFEEEVLLLVNELRSEGADCGAEGQFTAAGPLTMNPILRCSARLHSLDMFERDFFAHETPEGVDPFERMAEAGFVGSGGGENIALGQVTPEDVMVAWMESDGHCANVMRAEFATIGVGFHPGAGQRGIGSNYWTQNFGAPPFMRGGSRR